MNRQDDHYPPGASAEQYERWAGIVHECRERPEPSQRDYGSDDYSPELRAMMERVRERIDQGGSGK